MNTHYRALPTITSNGKALELDNILQVVVEESVHYPCLFSVVIRNDYQPGNPDAGSWGKQTEKLEIGKRIEIGFEPSTTISTNLKTDKKDLIQGEVTCIETQFTEGNQAPIVVRGYDVGHHFHRGRFNRSFQNMTDSDVVKKIADEANIDIGQIDPSGDPHEYLCQQNQTNMEFLKERATKIGFEFFVKDGKLYFCRSTAEETIPLTWLEDLRSFKVRVNSNEQVQAVEVRGWDYTTKQPIVANAESPKNVPTKAEISQLQPGSQINSAFEQMSDPPKMVVVDQPVFSPKEADAIAQSLCDEYGGEFLIADAKAEGNPNIRPGKKVELKDLGPYSGEYYVTETRHTYSEGVYSTEFCIRGLRSGDLLTTLAPKTQLSPSQTVLVGIVTDNVDPENLGRVKVKFPTLTEEHASNWARVVSMGAGNSRGFDCLPEIEDEVLVAFEHGDIRRPYILGGVWNGKDAPPNQAESNVQDGKVRLRTLQTRTGHKLQFVEEDQNEKAGVYLETTAGHKVRLNDSERCVEVETAGSHMIKLDDDGQAIEIKTSAGQTISLNDPNSISISSNGTLNLNAPAGISSSTGGGGFSNTVSSMQTTATGAIGWTTGSAFSVASGGTVVVNAPTILLNGLVKINGLVPVVAPA